MQNNNDEKDGTTVYAMAFSAEEIDYLDTKAEGDAMRCGASAGPSWAHRVHGVVRHERRPNSTKYGDTIPF